MFENIIEFTAPKEYTELEKEKDTFPVPIKTNIPEWFKKLEHSIDNATVKGCIPFLDSLTTGYLLKTPQDMLIKHGVEVKDPNINNGNPTKGSINKCPLHYNPSFDINMQSDQHGPGSFNHNFQAKGWPQLDKNHGGHVHKFVNPWHIKTPKGYSCLFLPPLNNHDDRFEIIPGIVDTDSYIQEINFPMLLNGDKYKLPIEFLIKKGTPYVQIIPFKRESWKMKINGKDVLKMSIERHTFKTTFLNTYKNFFWSKKSYK